VSLVTNLPSLHSSLDTRWRVGSHEDHSDPTPTYIDRGHRYEADLACGGGKANMCSGEAASPRKGPYQETPGWPGSR